MLALKPHKGTWAPIDAAHTPVEAAHDVGWRSQRRPGGWHQVTRRLRDGHTETWWADFQVRGETAIHRHCTLVCCAFSFCWQAGLYRRPIRTGRRPPLHGGGQPAGQRGGTTRPSISDKLAALPRWPAALRRIRGWLTPATLLQRYWRTWSNAPPPPQLQDLLTAVSTGQAIGLYLPP